MPPPMVSVVVPSRPAAARFSLISASAAGELLERVVHRQPAVADERGAALGRGAVAADEEARLRLLHRLRVEHHRRRSRRTRRGAPPRPRSRAAGRCRWSRRPDGRGSWKSRPVAVPLLLEPAGADAELDPAAREDVERGDRACGDERVAQADVVDVGAEPHGLRRRGDRGQRHERVERGGVRRDRRVRVARVRAALHLHREHEVLRQPHRLEPRVLGGLRGGRPELGVDPCEHHTDLHGARTYGYCHHSSSRGPGGSGGTDEHRTVLVGRQGRDRHRGRRRLRRGVRPGAHRRGRAGGARRPRRRARRAARAAELRDQGREAIGVQVDITDPDAAAAMVQRATDEFGGVDILINNAALMKEIPMGSLLTLPLDWWERVMQVNVMGALVCARAVGAVDARAGRRPHHQPGVGRCVHPRRRLQHQQARARQPHRVRLATELGPQGINVNAIAPGFVADEAGYESLGKDDPMRAAILARGAGQEGRTARRPRRHHPPAGVERRRLDQRPDDQRRRRLDHEGLNRWPT